MRKTLAGSLSQPCHSADTFITARHSRHSARRQEAHHHLLYLCRSAHMPPPTLEAHMNTHMHVHVCRKKPRRVKISEADPLRVLWLQRGSEARISDPGEASGLGASPGHRLTLLTFYRGHTKRGRAGGSILSRLCAEPVGGRLESSMETRSIKGLCFQPSEKSRHHRLHCLFYCLFLNTDTEDARSKPRQTT